MKTWQDNAAMDQAIRVGMIDVRVGGKKSRRACYQIVNHAGRRWVRAEPDTHPVDVLTCRLGRFSTIRLQAVCEETMR